MMMGLETRETMIYESNFRATSMVENYLSKPMLKGNNELLRKFNIFEWLSGYAWGYAGTVCLNASNQIKRKFSETSSAKHLHFKMTRYF